MDRYNQISSNINFKSTFGNLTSWQKFQLLRSRRLAEKRARKRKATSRAGDKNCARNVAARDIVQDVTTKVRLIGGLAVARERNRRVKRENFRDGNDAESYVWLHGEKKERETTMKWECNAKAHEQKKENKHKKGIYVRGNISFLTFFYFFLHFTGSSVIYCIYIDIIWYTNQILFGCNEKLKGLLH